MTACLLTLLQGIFHRLQHGSIQFCPTKIQLCHGEVSVEQFFCFAPLKRKVQKRLQNGDIVFCLGNVCWFIEHLRHLHIQFVCVIVLLQEDWWANDLSFTNLDFPEIRGPISLPKRYLLGEIGRVRSRANLTRYIGTRKRFALLQSGPLLVINRVITPINGLIYG